MAERESRPALCYFWHEGLLGILSISGLPWYRCLSNFKSHVLRNVAGTAMHAYLELDGASDIHVYQWEWVLKHENNVVHVADKWLLLLLFKFRLCTEIVSVYCHRAANSTLQQKWSILNTGICYFFSVHNSDPADISTILLFLLKEWYLGTQSKSLLTVFMVRYLSILVVGLIILNIVPMAWKKKCRYLNWIICLVITVEQSRNWASYIFYR